LGGVGEGPAPGAGFALIQDGKGWLQFEAPERILLATTSGDVHAALRELDAVAREGLWAAGFIAYEAAAAFGLAVRAPQAGLPLLWFGVYRKAAECSAPVIVDAPSGCVGPWEPALGAPEHARALAALQEHIGRGDTYQVNFTFPLRAGFTGEPSVYFASLLQAQRSRYAAYLDTGRFAVCSVSPELFFDRDGDRLRTRPMKGTAPRGRTAEEDAARAAALVASEKDRAENLMVVDMLRNDLGRVAVPGSVRVRDLFTAERYPTLLQMTSSVEARTEAPLSEIISALFPCASVTGAPKVRTMQIIAEMETTPRGIYTGAVGYVGPRRRASFNVAIRTVVVDRESKEAVYGVGSGVVADSNAGGEYAECLLKARILSETPFRLLETMRWTPEEGFFLREAHLDRLMASATFFGGEVSRAQVECELASLEARLGQASRIRLLVDLDGRVETEASALEAWGQVVNGEPQLPTRDLPPVPVALAGTPVDEASPWLYHKTTRREAYDQAQAERPDVHDVVLWNSRGEITEACRSNVVLDVGGGLITPPVRSGLLAGTFRALLLASGQVREQAATVADLERADRVFLVNSVRGWQRAQVAGKEVP
jgi:para-aminobenzoate synthetase/4-amino-4-deoxychorismate lyase